MKDPEKIPNIGPASGEWLSNVGIESLEDLRQIGSVEAYALVKRSQRGASLNLLWALEAALLNIHWQELTKETKQRLRQDLDALLS